MTIKIFWGCRVDEDHLGLAVKSLINIKQDIKRDMPHHEASNALVGYVSKDGVKHNSAGTCHYAVKTFENASVLYSKWTAPDTAKNNLYLKWITSGDSPWRDAFPPEDIIVDGYDINSYDFRHAHGFINWHLQKLPSNVQHQFLIATRIAKQQPYLVDTWYDLVVNHGYDPSLAFIWMATWSSVQQSFRITNKNSLTCVPVAFNYGEFNLDIGTSGPETPENFLIGRMVGKKNKPFADNPAYAPVNALWGINTLNPSVDLTYTKFLQQEYGPTSDHKIGEFKPGRFGGKQWTVTKEECLKIGLLEQHRMFNKLGISDVRVIA